MGTLSPKEHIEEIRKTKFYPENPLIIDLHEAVKNLSAELYAKDVHFLMELIQNAEDNQYDKGVDPKLQFIITSKDITGTRAPATLLILNNEKGFSPKNIESICSVGRSTKKGNRRSGYIGEKGIGFKSVFLITATPYVFSNGYQIRFNEEPCPHCGLGYIVPEWVEENPTLEGIKQICGEGNSLPTTIIVLPLKPEKVGAVKQQLSTIHPEILLFLSKIKQLSVKEDNEDPRLNTVTAVAISSEINFMTRKNMNAESYNIRLSAEENEDPEKECMYHMWRQRFPVRPENKVERRLDVEEWVVTLAFPNQERLNRGRSSPGIYAFLPTEMVTNFPFIIQADFVLASSRETILLDDKWNQGILDCVASAFMDAFKSLVISTDDAPVSTLTRFFEFLPVDESSYQELNAVRDKIKEKVVEESIVPCETYSKQKHFYKPHEVGRLLPAFWDILTEAREQRVYLENLSSHGSYIISSSFDQARYSHILDFLGVRKVDKEWYAKCIQSSNLVMVKSEDIYLKLLLFIAENWESTFRFSNMKSIPLIKYVGLVGNLSYFSLDQCRKNNSSVNILLAERTCPISWLISWNKEFSCAGNHYFVPETTQEAIHQFPHKQTLLGWLEKETSTSTLNTHGYASLIRDSIINDCDLTLAYSHFLYHSSSKGYLLKWQVEGLCKSMPLIDSYGRVSTDRQGVLVPANGSKWEKLIVSNPWRDEGYVELKEDYLYSQSYAGQYTSEKELIGFLETYVGACDIPHIFPPNAGFSSVNDPLRKEYAFLLLDWIRELKYRGVLPQRFLTAIREGSWLKTTINGHRPPSKSFFINSALGDLLRKGSVLVDIPMVDQTFYGDKLCEYEEELKAIGVMFSTKEACEFIAKELMSRAASFTLSTMQVFSMLEFIRYLRRNHFPMEDFVNGIKNGRWLKTCCGDRCPDGAILYDAEWETASQISNLPFIDKSHYGEKICDFKEELQLLGVMVGFTERYQLVVNHLKSSSNLVNLTAKAIFFILECIRFSNDSGKLVSVLQGSNCLKTTKGFNAPCDCYLYDPIWGCVLKVFNNFPVIDHKFYGDKILSYKNELERMGVVVDFEGAIKAFGGVFEQKASQKSFTKQHVESFLSCYRKLKGAKIAFPFKFSKTLTTAEWLRTRLGAYKPPQECILFGPEWELLSAITLLPFIDDGDKFYGKGIHEYKEELRMMGVAITVKDGLKLISAGLRFPSDPSSITPENVFSLLECIRLMQECHEPLSFDDGFAKQLSRKWLKTKAGYETPERCLLFDSHWKLEPMDGPFIDENFYGPKIASYKKELRAIGVIGDCNKGCSVMADYLGYHSELSTIVRIYWYLSGHDWKPEKETNERKMIWIPNGDHNGELVNPEDCVIHDKDDLFSSKFYVLERHYEKKLLPFFSSALGVRSNPQVDDYIELWKEWENSVEQFTHDKSCKFWKFILQHNSQKTKNKLSESLMKLPVTSNSNGILLSDKSDVFVADNLYMKNLFENESVFVWYPQPSLPSLNRFELLDMYKEIGVCTISESVQKEESFQLDDADFNEVEPRSILIGKGLVKLILGFLACSSLKMDVEKRHKAVQGLFELKVYEVAEPITVSYSLSLSSGRTITKKADRMMRWENSKLFVQKMDLETGNASMIKYATYFSEVISMGILCEKVDHVGSLSELIKLGFLLKFDEEAVEFLMESKDLQIFLEDKEFLNDSFSFQ